MDKKTIEINNAPYFFINVIFVFLSNLIIVINVYVVAIGKTIVKDIQPTEKVFGYKNGVVKLPLAPKNQSGLGVKWNHLNSIRR